MNNDTIHKPWTPPGTCITEAWVRKYDYVPASQQPAIAAKQAYYRLQQYQEQAAC